MASVRVDHCTTTCPACGRSWPQDYWICPEDGTSLVMRREAAELEPGDRVGEYVVEGKVAEGGMGAVYLAVHPVLGRRGAIKVIRTALCGYRMAIDRFLLEARTVSQCGHPNIVDVFSFGALADGRPYFIMEWLVGESLTGRLKRERLSLEDALTVIEQTAQALDAAHELGVIHRDVKPDNVFLVADRSARFRVKLLDFGTAKLLSADAQSLRLTATGQSLGTPAYVSPEQARALQLTPQTDVYSLGVLAFLIVTGESPFAASSMVDLMHAHVSAAPPKPSSRRPDLPAAVDDLVHSMLAKDPVSRPTMAQVVSLVADCRKHLAPAPWDARAAPTNVPATSPSASRQAVVLTQPVRVKGSGVLRRSAIFIASLTLVACFLAAILWRARQKHGDAEAPQRGAALPHEIVLAEAPRGARAARPDSGAHPPAELRPVPVEASGWIVLHADARTGTIVLDGQRVGDRLDGTPLPASPGDHSLVVSAPGRKDVERSLSVSPGDVVVVDVKLPQTAPPTRTKRVVPSRKAKPLDNYTLDPFSDMRTK